MHRPPEHRWQALQEYLQGAAPEPANETALALVRYLKDEGEAQSAAAQAYSLFEAEEHRPVMDAFLLAGATAEQLHAVLKVAPEVTEAYRLLFMDTTVFRHRLDIFSYAQKYEADAYGKELVRAAVTVGLRYLEWTFGSGDTQVDPRMVIRQTMADAFFRGLAHRGNALGSNVAKEAQKWWQMSVRNAELLERVDPQTAKTGWEELRLALEGADKTTRAEDAPVPIEEILH